RGRPARRGRRGARRALRDEDRDRGLRAADGRDRADLLCGRAGRRARCTAVRAAGSLSMEGATMTQAPTTLRIDELLDGYRRGLFTPTQIAEHVLQRI